jgi:hypothetical protein
MSSERYNAGKPRLSFFIRSFRWVNHCIARVKEFGAVKYAEDNWRQGGKPDSEYWDSFFRHMDYYFSGEEYDQDSGCHHIGHMVWNLSVLMELNHSTLPVIDKELFIKRCEYWRNRKAAENGMAPANADEGVRQDHMWPVKKGGPISSDYPGSMVVTGDCERPEPRVQ